MTQFIDSNKIVVDGEELSGYIKHCNKKVDHKFTIAVVKNTSEVFGVGISILSTKDKCYNKSFGRNVAIGRALRHPIAFIQKLKMEEKGIRDLLCNIENFFLEKQHLKEAIQILGNKNGNPREVMVID